MASNPSADRDMGVEFFQFRQEHPDGPNLEEWEVLFQWVPSSEPFEGHGTLTVKTMTRFDVPPGLTSGKDIRAAAQAEDPEARFELTWS